MIPLRAEQTDFVSRSIRSALRNLINRPVWIHCHCGSLPQKDIGGNECKSFPSAGSVLHAARLPLKSKMESLSVPKEYRFFLQRKN
jgi:hypothetical protein